MDVKCLMIGDYVMFGKAHKVTATVSMAGEGYVHVVDGACDPLEVFDDYIFPIPISVEILKAKGFVDRGEYGWQRLQDKQCPRHLTYFIKDEMFAVGHPDVDDVSCVYGIRYYHQFQQMLRLCGLWNLQTSILKAMITSAMLRAKTINRIMEDFAKENLQINIRLVRQKS